VKGLSVLPVLALLVLSRSAAAEPEDPLRDPEKARVAQKRREPTYGWERPFALSLNAGYRNPTGLGLSFEAAPIRFLALEAGAGFGSEGPQLAGMLRLRIQARSNALSLGAGLSRGPFRAQDDCFFLTFLFRFGGCASDEEPEPEWDAAVFRNFELSIDRRTAWSTQFRFFFGVTTILNPEDTICDAGQPPERCATSDGFTSLYLGLAFGFVP